MNYIFFIQGTVIIIIVIQLLIIIIQYRIIYPGKVIKTDWIKL